LQTCDTCRRKLEVLRQFYVELAHTLREPEHLRIEELSKSQSPNIIRLRAYHPQPDMSTMGADDHIHLLAAQTTTDTPAAIVLRATYASAKDKVLVRVLEDRVALQYQLYILSEEEAIRAHVLIGIGTTASVEFIATNASGLAILPISETIDWPNVSIVVLTPVAVFEMREGLGSDAQLTSGSTELHVTGSTVSLESTSHVGHALLLLDQDFSVVKKVVDGEIELSEDELRDVRMIKLFP
jgi:hypothetical protein